MTRIDIKWIKFLHIIYVLSWVGAELTIDAGNGYFKYFFLFLPIALGALIMLHSRPPFKAETRVFGQHLLYNAFFVFISIAAIFFNDTWAFQMIDLNRTLFPLAYAFVIINLDDYENKDFYVDTIFFATVFVMLYHYHDSMTFANILSINFLKSFSPFESAHAHTFGFIALYYYIRKKNGRLALSVFMSYLALKRLHFAFVLFIICFGWLLRRVKVNNALLNTAKVLFCLTPVFMDFIVSPTFVTWFDSTFNTSLYMFTMSRLAQYTIVLNYDGSLLGLQAVERYLQRIGYPIIFHSDLLRISIETTIVGLFLYVNAFLNMVKAHRNVFAFLGVLLMLLSMFISVNSALTHTYLILYFICCMDPARAAQEDYSQPGRYRQFLALLLQKLRKAGR